MQSLGLQSGQGSREPWFGSNLLPSQVGQGSASANPLAWSNVGIRPESLQVGQGRRARAFRARSPYTTSAALQGSVFEILHISFRIVRSWVIWSGVILVPFFCNSCESTFH